MSKSEIEPALLPSVSVVIPARNEAAYLSRCIEALERLSYPKDKMAVYVVDNGSIDSTVAIAESLGVRVISFPNGLVGAVRNAGASQSEGEIIAFVDGDCVVDRKWLIAAVDALRCKSVGIAGGGYVPNPAGSWIEAAWASSKRHPRRTVDALPGGSMVFRRQVFDEIGGFNERLSAGEDDDICCRVRSQGLAVVCLPECYVTHLGYPSTIRGVAKRQIWHGSNQLDVAESLADRQLLLTHLFLVGLLFGLPAALFGRLYLATAAFALCCIPVFVMAYTKARQRRRTVLRFIQMIPIAGAFYLGRCIGLIKNYWAIGTSLAAK